jgi:hypothetical protein
MLNKLKNKLKQWLFAEEIKNINYCLGHMEYWDKQQSRAVDYLTEAINSYKDSKILAQNAHTMVSRLIDIGVDVHYKEPHSWAVICIQGKPEYIKFINLGRDNKTAKEIMMWLRQFEGSNIIIDSPFSNYFDEEMKGWKL